jgi:hypothetical protein
MAHLLWEAIRLKPEKKSHMITDDLCCRLQTERCPEHSDICAHLNKLQTMKEDLASIGGSMTDEDFTSIILRSIPPLYDTYITVISATSSLLNQSLSPTNLINAICNEADWEAIKNPRSKEDDHDAAFVVGSSKKGSGSSKKLKKEVKCWNCHKKGHSKAECWASGGGVEGKAPRKWKGKQVECPQINSGSQHNH